MSLLEMKILDKVVLAVTQIKSIDTNVSSTFYNILRLLSDTESLKDIMSNFQLFYTRSLSFLYEHQIFISLLNFVKGLVKTYGVVDTENRI